MCVWNEMKFNEEKIFAHEANLIEFYALNIYALESSTKKMNFFFRFCLHHLLCGRINTIYRFQRTWVAAWRSIPSHVTHFFFSSLQI